MTKLTSWVQDNKLSSFLLLILFFIVLIGSKQESVGPMTLSRSSLPTMQMREGGPDSGVSADYAVGFDSKVGIASPMMAPPAETSARMKTTETSLSLKVDNVADSISRVESIATTAGGYMIDSSLSTPEGAANGSITIRVPSEKRIEVLQSLRGLAQKVVFENVSGQDITDQFVDNEERLRILESTKTKFETILTQATDVSEMLQVQREILNLQNQIDSIKGSQKYLEGSAKLTRVSLYLSTDELALPYTPDSSWRPNVVFKEAVRSLLLSLRQVGSLAIWAAVYAPVALVVGLVLWGVRRLATRR